MPRSWPYFAILHLLLTAAAGVLLRAAPYFQMTGIDYGNVLHAHSHTGVLGWGYVALFLLLANQFFPDSFQVQRHIRICFVLTQFVVIGMFIAFFLQGYALFSVIFSSLHGLLSYWFVFWFFKHSHHAFKKNKTKTNVPLAFACGALFALFISYFGPWSLGYLASNGLRDTPWFDLSVYFFLHFQYNGWFLFALVAVVYAVMDQQQIPYSLKRARFQFWIGIVSLFPAFLVSALWLNPGPLWQTIAFVAGCLQLTAALLLGVNVWHARHVLRLKWSTRSFLLLALAIAALLLKSVMEPISTISGLKELVFDTRSVVIGFLHLVLLGFMSFLCLALFLQKGWLNARSRIVRTGSVSFIVGFLLNELVLFLQGLMQWTGDTHLPYANALLFAAALLLLGGSGLFGASYIIDRQKDHLSHGI